MTYTVYILQSLKDESYYVGQTTDVQRRLEEHNNGDSPSTKFKRPWNVVYTEEFVTRAEAMRREKVIKSMKSKQFIETLIQERSAVR